MNLSELCIRRPVMTTLLMVAFVVFGIAGYRQLSIGALPRVDFPTIQVSASLPGASPETMASTVATPLERQFSAIPGVSSITSSSQLGSTQITLQFDLDRNIDAAAQDVQSALSVAQRRLPVEMTTPPSFRKVNPADQPILLIALTSSTLPLTAVNEYADSVIGQRIGTLPGVAQVQIFGEQKKAVRVQVNPEAMASRGIALEDVQRVVASATSSAPVGSLNGPRQQLTLQATGQPVDADSYRSLIVAYRNGAPVRLSDVASIIDGVENNRLSSWYNGVRSITLAVQKQPDANTVAVVDAVKALVPQLRSQVPPSVSVEIFNDRSTSIRDSMEDVKFTLVLTMVLVVLVIYLFLRKATTTLIPAAALPISIIGTFAGMYMLGFSLNNISLMALTLAVGFVVDDAIVMLENIHRHVEEGMQPMEAALKGSREIGFTIVSMTVSLIAVFIPVLFMGGLVGRLFREFAVTISIAILVSGVVSLTLTPMLCSRFMKPQAQHKEGRISRAMERGFLGLQSAYGWTLRVVLRHRLLTLMAALASLAISAYAYQAIPKGFFPNEDTGLIAGLTEGSQDISFEAMVVLQSRAAKIVGEDPDVLAVNSNVGSGGGGGAVNTGRLFIQLKDRAERQASAPEVIQRLRGKLGQIPGINVFMQAVQNINLGGRLSRGQYQYTYRAAISPSSTTPRRGWRSASSRFPASATSAPTCRSRARSC
jgi:HAE1 family hydrophobic/amphiphilic exporter-1